MKEKSEIDTSSTLLLVFIVILFITTISISSTQNFVDNWHKVPLLSITLTILQILRTVSFILPTFAIKNKTYKIVGIILSSIVVVYLLISPLKFLIK